MRLILLGPDDSFANRIACGYRPIVVLALVALTMHALDLLTGIRMIELYGLSPEQNPLARLLFRLTGPFGLSIVKSGVVTIGVLALLALARRGRPRLARNSLLVIGMLGLLGFSSNLI
jgi:uncharacterized membrane protein